MYHNVLIIYTFISLSSVNSFWVIHHLSIFPYKSTCIRNQSLSFIFKCPVPYTKFNWYCPFGSEEDFFNFFTVYGHGSNHGHVTTFPINFRSSRLMQTPNAIKYLLAQRLWSRSYLKPEWPGKVWTKNDLDVKYMYIFMYSFSWLYLQRLQ